MPHELRFRQIHLDFHTSEHIPGIGSEFDPDRFVHTLKEAAVDSVTCFSRCHHGWIYHQTRLPFRHPNLTCDLLEQQIRACHAHDIRVPIYITVGWDELQARLHPEWIEIDGEGKQVGRAPLGEGWGWHNLDFASPYLDYVIEQTREVCDLFGNEVDGFFFDILFQRGVHSSWCLDRFHALGWDPKDLEKQKQMRADLVKEACDRIYGAVRAKNKDCTVFFNSGHIGPGFRGHLGDFTHLEVESLPTGGWGYMHFPMTARYARTLLPEYLAMTGKFSEMWGHFASYKNPAALEYECFQALAQAGKCSVGDQLPPGGKLDAATYDLIGPVYRKVREVEPWCKGARPVTEIALLNAELFESSSERMDPDNLGASRMLIEGRHQFDLVDLKADWTRYGVLLLPSVARLDQAGEAKLAAYVAQGGKVVATGKGSLDSDGEVLSVFRDLAKVEGDLAYSPDFLRPASGLGPRTDTDFVMYERGVQLQPLGQAEVLATVTEPYFNRTYRTFCSHAHTPPANPTQRPGILLGDGVALFAHPVFATYARHSMSFHRDAFLSVLRRLLPVPLVELEGPTSLQATLTEQPGRWMLHLLHYIPERRGLNFDVVEDPLPVSATEVFVRASIQAATFVPSGEALPVRSVEHGTIVQVPDFLGHAMVALELG